LCPARPAARRWFSHQRRSALISGSNFRHGSPLAVFDFARAASYCSAMDSLHAPWRIEYILAPKPVLDESVFTGIAQSSDDAGNLVITRGKTCYALLNRYPYVGGHLMVVPYKQVPTLDGLDDQELTDLMLMTRQCQSALTKVMRPDGFNIGINLGKCAGAGIIEHLHIHVVPRWNGDTNFMPIIAGVGVVPQALTEVAAQLRQAIAP
jgi:ATP adenylyltransferase